MAAVRATGERFRCHTLWVPLPGAAGSGTDPPGDAQRRGPEALIQRLNRIEGQIGGIQRMIEQDRHSLDILAQSSAVRAAIDEVSLILLEGHLRGWVAEAIGSRDGIATVEKVMEAFSWLVRSHGRHVEAVFDGDKTTGRMMKLMGCCGGGHRGAHRTGHLQELREREAGWGETREHEPNARSNQDHEAILKARLAHGEITIEEYQKLREALRD